VIPWLIGVVTGVIYDVIDIAARSNLRTTKKAESHRPEDLRLAHAPDVFVDGLAFDDVGAIPLLDDVAHVAIGITTDQDFGNRRRLRKPEPMAHLPRCVIRQSLRHVENRNDIRD
jgi:hypothetical protein